MKAMILAAGRGSRMRPLSDVVPKPLLEVADKPLIEYHIERLAHHGFKEIVINIAHLGHLIPAALGDGSRWGVRIVYSDEQEEGALESAGGIVKALPLLGDAPFLVVNADVWTDYPFDGSFNLSGALAHLILVPNPEHHPHGDFVLEDDAMASVDGAIKWTFSGIGYYSPQLFAHQPYGKAPLAPLLRQQMSAKTISAEVYDGVWIDVGTPQRLDTLNKNMQKGKII